MDREAKKIERSLTPSEQFLLEKVIAVYEKYLIAIGVFGTYVSISSVAIYYLYTR